MTAPAGRPRGAAIVFLTPRQVETAQPELREIYRQAFAPPPYGREEAVAASFADSLLRQTGLAGFRCAVAQEAVTQRLLGFAYGYTSTAGQWWHDHVARAMSPEQAQHWLLGAFELVEFAVLPEAQGRGLGSQLHDRLLDGLRYRTAVLSTLQAETVALKLYRKRGWVDLVDGYYFPGGSKPYRIMGLELEKRTLCR